MRSPGVSRVAAMALIAASLLLGFLTSVQVLRPMLSGQEPSGQAGGPTISVVASIPLEFRARVEAYKNNELVFAKDGDPWTLNFARLIKMLFFTTDATDWPDVRPTVVRQPNRLTTITTAITNFRYMQVVTVYAPVIGIGSGTAAPSVNDVSLQSTITLYDVIDPSNVALSDAGSFFWLNITGQFTGLAVTVGEVGLFVRVNEGTTDPLAPDQAFLLLLARDLISPPVTLAADDVLVVKYAIRISKDVLVRYGFCDLVQVVFGLGDRNLRGIYLTPCRRPTSSSALPATIAFGAANDCATNMYSSACVTAVFATASITYTNRFQFSTATVPGISLPMRSPMTTITTNSTHLIIRTTIRLGVSSDTTLYGLVLNRGGAGRPSASYITATLTYTAFTTRLVTVDGAAFPDYYSATWTVMFIPFNPPLSVPAGSKVQVTLELAIPIS
jgi:hypothetical protein